ncbi:putative DNA-binding protein with PD1-like motif [Brevibacterium epidermidis]|jgi:predicted DNA-binding protein with PD1-like motif|uniref:DNA-binding protein with PD1-like motif n=1 Tax=Brevibacterium epidermidis TaxID=1698 RepID=A0ABV4EHD2_BREEP
MSNGADSTALRQPTFPLKAPGTAVIHAGPQQNPRIVSVPTRCTEHILELPEGTDVFAALERSLTDFAVPGIVAEFHSGDFGHIDYVHPAYGPDAEHPMSFSETFTVDVPARLRHASATIGVRDGSPFCHIHASWTTSDNKIRGGHLLPGTLAGPKGLTIRLFALPDAQLISEVDPETGFSAFAPTRADHPADQPNSPEPSEPSESADSPNAVVSRVRPGEILDEAVLAVCRNAGFDSAEVVASLGSTTGVVFTDGTAPWPAVEFTHLGGKVTGARSAAPKVTLSCEVVDVAGAVHSGVIANGANPVAVTFELFVRRLA